MAEREAVDEDFSFHKSAFRENFPFGRRCFRNGLRRQVKANGVFAFTGKG